MAATYRLLVDWRDNGFADVADNVTARTLDQRTPVAASYGRDQSRQLSPTSPGELGFELDNRSRDYSPENTGSPLAGYVSPGRKVRLEASAAGTNVVLYAGYLDDFDLKPGINDRSVPVSCLDALGRLQGVSVTTPLYQGIRTGTAIGYLLDAVGWPSDLRDLDAGASYLPYWWLDETDAFDAIMQLADSEGPSALVTVDGAGRIVFRDRHHRLVRTRSLTAQATWRSAAIEPVISDPLTYNHGWKEIVNAVSVDVPLRTPEPRRSVVWSNPGLITIPASSSITLTATSSTPFLSALTPAAGTDYTIVSGTVTVSLSQTSGQSSTITVASSGGAIIQDLQLRAHAIQSASVKVTVEEPASIAKYGRRGYQSGRLPVWANQYDATAILTLIVAARSERIPTLSVTMRGAGSPTRLMECLTRSLSDRVRLTESLTGFDSDVYIERISHAINEGGLQHVTTFGVEKVPSIVTNPITFDGAGLGFGQGVFAGGGIDNPNTLMTFDQAGRGFGQGLFVN
jgi:hypothetical protein